MGAFFGLLGFFGMLTCLIMTLANKAKKRPVRKYAVLTGVFFILFISGYLIDTKGKKKDDKNDGDERTTQKQSTAVIEASTSERETASTESTTETESATTETELTTESGSTTTVDDTEEKISFVLIDDVGEYGKEVMLNAKTEFEEVEIAYYIPEGAYYVTNNNTVTVQISIFSGEPEYDGEWQYFVADENCGDPVVLQSGETKDIVIKEGQFVTLSDNKDNNVLFEMK